MAISQFAFRGIHYGIEFQNTNVANEVLENKIKKPLLLLVKFKAFQRSQFNKCNELNWQLTLMANSYLIENEPLITS